MLDARTELDPTLRAPLAKGEQVGEVIVELNGETVSRQPLVTLAAVQEGGLWRTVVDNVLMLLE